MFTRDLPDLPSHPVVPAPVSLDAVDPSTCGAGSRDHRVQSQVALGEMAPPTAGEAQLEKFWRFSLLNLIHGMDIYIYILGVA